jgi:formylglycine-generating enzyme required for sulfatase activity
MHQTRYTLLQLDASIPSRWIVGRQRIARVALRNPSVVDLTGVLLSVSWPALGDEHCFATEPVALPRNSYRNIDIPLKPLVADEHSLQLRLQCDLGGFLQQSIVTNSLHFKVSPVPHTPGELKLIVGENVLGDKALFGQMQTDQAVTNIGHTFNIQHGALDQTLEHWMHEDPALLNPKSLELFVESTTCRDWTNYQGIELVGIAPGEFDMGRSEGDAEPKEEERVRRVQLTQAFWVSRTPITQAQYLRVMKTLPELKFEDFRKPDHPVVNVNWEQANAFCEALTSAEHEARSLPPGCAYRLPTEAEWEYACRAGSPEPRYGELREIGATQASGGVFGPVGKYAPNAWGLHDMLGLVFEWCLDAYGPYQPFSLVAPLRTTPDGDAPLERVLRGGCYQGPDEFARASARASKPPDAASSRIGFRVVLARES